MNDTHDHNGAPGISFANQIVDLANQRIEAGETPEEIAAGMRHAAANFSAFAFFHMEPPRDPNPLAEEFVTMFEHYLSRHKPQDIQVSPGLTSIIEKAKQDL